MRVRPSFLRAPLSPPSPPFLPPRGVETSCMQEPDLTDIESVLTYLSELYESPRHIQNDATSDEAVAAYWFWRGQRHVVAHLHALANPEEA